MANRLQLFRERMSAFEGTADPSEAIESGYYVPAPEKLLVDRIVNGMALRPASSRLLIGGIGSGKTTQLLVASQRIIYEIEDIHAVYVDVSLHTDISQINTGDLIVITGLQLAKIIQDSKEDEKIKQSIIYIRNRAFGYREEISKLAQEALTKYRHIVIFFDGLDRIDNVQKFMDIVYSDIKSISSLGIGLLSVAPIGILYNKDYYNTVNDWLEFDYLPFFDVDNDPEAYKFFLDILQTRSSVDFIDKSAIKLLIHFSGGVLRDLINLTQKSIEETYLSGEDKVQEKHVRYAVDSFSKSQWLGISNEELKIIKQTLDTETFVSRTYEDIRLVVKRLILEYVYPKRRYAVHPAIKLLVEKVLN